MGYGLTLTRLVPLIVYNVKKRFLCETDDEVQEAWYPPPFRYATCVPADMLILTITICYSVIAPAILPFAVVYFGLGLLLMKHQVRKHTFSMNAKIITRSISRLEIVGNKFIVSFGHWPTSTKLRDT